MPVEFAIDDNDKTQGHPIASPVGSVHDNVSPVQDDTRAERAASSSSGSSGASLIHYVRSKAQHQALSPEGTTFLTQLKESFTKAPELGITSVRMPAASAELFVKDGIAVALIFEEHMRPDAYRGGTEDYVSRVHDEFRIALEIGNAESLLDVYVVLRGDYEKPTQWFDTVKEALTGGLYSDITYKMVKECRYDIVTDPNRVHDVIGALTPHKVLGRIDVGIVMNMLTDDRDRDVRDRDRNRDDRDRRDEYIELGAMGGFTDFYEVYEGRDLMYQPILHLTEWASYIRHSRMFPVLLANFLDYAITHKGWLAPFQSFGPNSPNLGNLWFDEDGRPEELTNIDQLNRFVRDRMFEPIVVVDIQPGRVTLPGMYAMANEKMQGPILEDFAEFFGSNHITDGPDTMFDKPIGMLTTLVNKEGRMVDSREIDYFDAIQATSDRRLLGDFLTYDNDALRRIDSIRDLGYKNVQPLYMTYMCPLREDALEAIMKAAGSSLRVRTDYNTNAPISIGAYFDRGRNISAIMGRTSIHTRRGQSIRQGSGIWGGRTTRRR